MRKHKYKAWNKRDKKMECVDFLNLSPANFCGQYYVAPPEDLFGVATRKGNLLSLDEVILLQYSGIEDSKNKEIFEGDVVRLAGYGNYVVEFPFLELYEAVAEGDVGAIQGNIYESPELEAS